MHSCESGKASDIRKKVSRLAEVESSLNPPTSLKHVGSCQPVETEGCWLRLVGNWLATGTLVVSTSYVARGVTVLGCYVGKISLPMQEIEYIAQIEHIIENQFINVLL